MTQPQRIIPLGDGNPDGNPDMEPNPNMTAEQRAEINEERDVQRTEQQRITERGDQTDTHPIVSATDDPRDLRKSSDAPTFLPEQAGTQANDRWKRIQAEFVDDPRKSVSEAHELVSDLVQRIIDTFSNERNDLEQQWSKGESVSTEDLRVCLQRYRSFFTRLLPLDEKSSHDV